MKTSGTENFILVPASVSTDLLKSFMFFVTFRVIPFVLYYFNEILRGRSANIDHSAHARRLTAV